MTTNEVTVRIAYADPPYPGCAKLYEDHPDYAGEVDHAELIARLERDYDGWVLHTASTTLGIVLPLVPPTGDELAAVRSCLARLGLLVAA